jgi:hypothetical protein
MPGAVAVALGRSRALGVGDADSDWDFGQLRVPHSQKGALAEMCQGVRARFHRAAYCAPWILAPDTLSPLFLFRRRMPSPRRRSVRETGS